MIVCVYKYNTCYAPRVPQLSLGMESVRKSEVGPSGIKVQMSKKFQQKPSNATTWKATSCTKMLAESPPLKHQGGKKVTLVVVKALGTGNFHFPPKSSKIHFWQLHAVAPSFQKLHR